MDGDALIKRFDLLPHVEGGYYRQVYRSTDVINPSTLPSRFEGTHERVFSTSIYFLLRRGDKSHLHRLKSDETWHFYHGDALKVVMLDETTKKLQSVILGTKFEDGEVPQFTVPAGVWFGSVSTGAYSFVGCTVAPGFEFADFEMAERGKMGEVFGG
ncbi:RmlC-like cupin domain-containing protein [Chytridium lagenaria]|nr:RmlC-like cupin domain-containing protein [Chytridium lagenaria]